MTRPVVSYDVFDTVVTRVFAQPRDVFVHLGARLRERGLHRLEPLEFARLRWRCEHAARRKSPWTEVLLEDIHRELASRLSWDEAAVREASELEQEVESRCLRAVPSMRAQLAVQRAAAGRLVFLSDMYLPSARLRSWLEREGVAEPGDLLLVSGEQRASKSSGGLFAAAREATGGEFSRWHHTGDHPFADVARPRELGLTATHDTRAHLTAHERRARGTDEEFAPPWRSLLAGAMRLARLERRPESPRELRLWETGTNVAGPLFFGFVRWTLAEAQRRGIKRLYFLARDGQIFWRIAQVIRQATPVDIECRYLHASRLVFAGPAELSTPEALRWLAAPTGHFHSLRQALWQLGLDEKWAHAARPAPLAGVDPETNLTPEQREVLADWLLAPERREILRAAMDRRCATARGYLEANGLRAGEPVGLVDAGWLGSIQRNLERILGTPEAPAPLTGFYLGLMPPRNPAPAGELVGYANTFAPLPLLREESHKVLIELMAQSDHGQVLGFESAADGWTPRLNAPGPVNLDEIRLFQDAVLAFSQRLLSTADLAPLPDGEFDRAVIALYRVLHDSPTEEEARLFGFLPHADQLYEQCHASLCAEPDLRRTISALLDFRKRPPYWWIGGQAALGQAPLLRGFRWLKRWKWRLSGKPE